VPTDLDVQVPSLDDAMLSLLGGSAPTTSRPDKAEDKAGDKAGAARRTGELEGERR
jgi:hypothetical protein